MAFWLPALVLVVVTAWVVLRPLLRGADGGVAGHEADVQVYKDQLAEVEGDLARGVISESEAQAIRTEVARRLLAAARAEAGIDAPAPRRATNAAVVGVALAVAGGGAVLYWVEGRPGMPDQPLVPRLAEHAATYAARPGQDEVEQILEARGNAPEQQQAAPDPEHLELLSRLETALEARPDDLEGHRLLVSNLARLGQWRRAADAQAEVLRILDGDATASDHMDHAEFQILAVNGYVSPEAEAALRRTLDMDPTDPRARYYSGLSAFQAGRADLAYDLWIRLMAESPPDAPWVAAIRSQIREVAQAAGREVPDIGPDAADLAAAAEMSEEERAAMIEGMVAGLSDRLAREGGPAEDWARLIRAYGVLGDLAQAQRIWTEAQEVFADAPADLALIRQAARDAEIVQ